jgi:hypothetical protein
MFVIWPVRVTCGTPEATCRTAPDAQGVSFVYYEIEPLGVMLIEQVTRSNIPIYYTAGIDSQ